MSKATHYYWFAYSDMRSASIRFRGKYVLEALSKGSLDQVETIYPGYTPKRILRFVHSFFRALIHPQKNSVIYIQKVTSDGWYASCLHLLTRLAPIPVIYDLDDAEYLRCNPKSLNRFLSNADHIIVGSAALYHYASRFNNNITLLTSSVPEYDHFKKEKNDVLTIGWIGGYNSNRAENAPFSHKKILQELLFPALEKTDFPMVVELWGITEESDSIELRNQFASHPHIELRIPLHVDWLNELYIQKSIARWDLGIGLLVDHPFNEAKSAFKIKQCLAAGIPVLANSIGENTRFIIHGKNGLIVESVDALVEAFGYFHTMDIDTYQRFSTCAKSSHQKFDLNDHASVLSSIAEKEIKRKSTGESKASHITGTFAKRERIAEQSA